MPSSLDRTGVYVLENVVNTKVYVGSSAVSMAGRKKEHIGDLREGKHSNGHLQAAWNKYGEEAFCFQAVKWCPPEECLEHEQYYIDLYQSANPDFGYNLTPTAGSLLGYKHSEDAKQKIGRGNKGKKRTPEMCAHFSEVKKGKKLTEEHKQKLSRAGKGKKRSPETCARIGAVHRGKKKSAIAVAKMKMSLALTNARPEVRQRRSAACKKRPPISAETRAKMSASNARKGKPLPLETKAKISAANRGRNWTDEMKVALRARNAERRLDPEYRARRSAAARVSAAKRLSKCGRQATLWD